MIYTEKCLLNNRAPIMLQVKEEQRTSLALKNAFVDLLERHLSDANIPKPIADVIADSTFFKENPSYYMYYPHLFAEVFSIKDEHILNTLSLAGFLYYRAVIIMDTIFDEKSSTSSFESYMISDICKEESIKLLSELFPATHSFWKFWNGRKMEYAKAYKIDQSTHSIQSYKDYEQLADYKCAFGKVAIDALYHISGMKEPTVYAAALNSHKEFYTAFQIVDDITDIKEDVENGQFNIAHFELEKHIGKKALEGKSIDELKKTLYLDDLVNQLYDRALGYIKQAQVSIDNYNLNEWKYEIQKLHNTIIVRQLNVTGFVKAFHIRNKMSNTKAPTKRSMDDIAVLGQEFIRNAQEREGNWADYFYDPGISTIWTTGFVMSSKCINTHTIPSAKIAEGMAWLTNNIDPDQVWGYNSKWIADADTTSFVMLSLLKHGVEISNDTLQSWYSFQNTDGGFGLYKDEKAVIASINSEEVTNVSGWIRSHFCVSAAAYLFFCTAKIENETFNALRKYLIHALRSDNTEFSYWWTHNVYSFSLIIKASILRDDEEILILLLPHFETFMESTSYDTIISERNYFYMGLLLESIGSSRYLFKEYRQQADEIKEILISEQLEDGSWPASYSRRIPVPMVEYPDMDAMKWRKGDRGFNCLVEDFHRLFSTTASLSGLQAYKEIAAL